MGHRFRESHREPDGKCHGHGGGERQQGDYDAFASLLDLVESRLLVKGEPQHYLLTGMCYRNGEVVGQIAMIAELEIISRKAFEFRAV